MAEEALRAADQPGAAGFSRPVRSLRVGGADPRRRGLASAGPLSTRRRRVLFLSVGRRGQQGGKVNLRGSRWWPTFAWTQDSGAGLSLSPHRHSVRARPGAHA